MSALDTDNIVRCISIAHAEFRVFAAEAGKELTALRRALERCERERHELHCALAECCSGFNGAVNRLKFANLLRRTQPIDADTLAQLAPEPKETT